MSVLSDRALRQRQWLNEKSYDVRQIEEQLIDFIRDSDELLELIDMGVTLVKEWVALPHSYRSKQQRAVVIDNLDIPTLVQDIIVLSLYVQEPEPLINTVGNLADRLGWSVHREALVASGELLAVLAQTNLYKLTKESAESQIYIESNVSLPQELIDFTQQAGYLPPMVYPPNLIHNNFQSGYLSIKDSVILKRYNQHSGCVSLDTLNSKNAVPLKFYYPMVSTVPEIKSKKSESLEDQIAWEKMSHQTLKITQMLISQGNRFYMLHKVDKRGRMYAQGYHINSQGTGYKKAVLDFAEEEVILGVPDHFKI